MPAFLPIIAGLAGSFIPGIADALASSKTKEEAAAILAPEIQSKVAELVGRGVRRDEAEAQVMEGMQGEIQAKMQEGSLPAWAEMGLGLVTGLGAGALAAKIGSKAAAKAMASSPNTGPMPKPIADGVRPPFGDTAKRLPMSRDKVVEATPDEVIPPTQRGAFPAYGASRDVPAEYEMKRPFPLLG